MELSTAISLIKNAIDQNTSAQTWADLGAGKGLFTKALASLLPDRSIVCAIDKDASSLRSLESKSNRVAIHTITHDFTQGEIKGAPFDGILMANSLHYAKNQVELLKRLVTQLKPGGRIVLIEYDMDTPNPWVPYPISYNKLIQLCKASGLELAEELGETPSVYNRARIYSVLLKQNTI